MIVIRQESPCSQEAIDLLKRSCEHVFSLQEDFNHTYKLDILSSNQARFFLIRKDSLAVGCAAYVHLDKHTVELKHVYLDDSLRGLGCGKELLLHIERIAKHNQVKIIVLETLFGMVAAYAMYQKYGYVECESYIENPLNDSIFMKKEI